MEKLTPILRQYALPLGLGVIGLILSGYGLIQSLPTQNDGELSFTTSNESTESVNSIEKKELTVDVSGAVKSPGVYVLADGSRIKDAIEKAGGLSDEADTDFIERSFNLARLLNDGSKLYIPEIGESIGSSAENSRTEYSQDVAGVDARSLININSASESELDTLSGIGPVTAGKIIDNRPYNSIDELVSKKVVSNSVFEKIKDSISLY